MNQPFLKFLRDNFPEVLKTWNLSDDEWARMFAWYFGNGNAFQFLRGGMILGFVLFRPMTKEQLANRHRVFEWNPEGEYLYIPMFVTRREWRGRGMWNLVKGLASYTYPDVRFVAYETWRKEELTIVPAQRVDRGRRHEQEIGTSTRPASSRPKS